MIEVGHGQVWWADLSGDKVRPVVVLTRSWVAPRLTRVLVAPVTSRERKIPSEVRLGPEDSLQHGSVANLDNVQLVDQRLLLKHVGDVRPERWREFCSAMAHVMACDG